MSPTTTSRPPTLRDPALLPRATALLLACLIAWPLLRQAQVDPAVLVDPANLQTIGHFLGAFLPPEHGREFLGLLGTAVVETLAIATAGMALAFLLAVPLALLASRALSRSDIGPGPGAVREGLLRNGVRSLHTLLRGIPELVWALVFVRIFGLGPAAGVLALGLTYGGMLAKVYGEIFESADRAPVRALLTTGATPLAACLYGLLPASARELTSYTVYRWECAVRASVVMGFVGAGGLGQLMDQAMKLLNGGEAASILLSFLALVLAADTVSSGLRHWISHGGRARRRTGIGLGGTLFLLALAAAVASSVHRLELDFSALWTQDGLHQFGDFWLAFIPPDLSREWMAKVALGTMETLAISAVGTGLAAVAGSGLALAAASRQGLLRGTSRFLLNALRSVPELVWATLAVLAAGLGPFAGSLALALHTSGVLGRLFAEAIENAPTAPGDALREAGAGRLTAFLYGTLPEALPQALAYTLYRWEMNIRMAAVLGFVGAGGLGQLLYVELSLFHHAQASTVIIAMLLLSIAVDHASAWLRQRLMR
ncbi:MAG TPA: phosphonate ABC transporter, permease protein PhnE [Rhodocyclaceae bacterium]|nr:phosphonate ABC transporter, permease protein PhnE [Rhodocyclaceae bacterium]